MHPRPLPESPIRDAVIDRSLFLAYSSAIVSLISARGDCSSLMSAAWSGGSLGSTPITIRLQTSRRTLSSLACNSANVGMGRVKADSIPRCGLRATYSHRTLFEGRLLRSRMRFLPKPPRDLQGIHPLAFPPRDFIAGLMQLSMMPTAERHSELIAHFETDGARLSETQVMRIRRLSSTNQTRL